MLYAAFVFLIISLIAGGLGFTNVSQVAGGIAKILFFLFLFLFAIALILALFVLA